MPTVVDSNSPAFWRDGRLFWYGSAGQPMLSEGPDQFGPWESRVADLQSLEPWPHWMESVWPENSDLLWGWYHHEPGDLVPESTLTAPKIGAVMSTDGGLTLVDLGTVLESGDPLDPTAQNGYFAGGHGDFSVILDRQGAYFYFLFDNYGGPAETQGVCIARMAYADRANPAGKVWKYHNGSWQEAGIGGRVTPIFPVTKSWRSRTPDALWGPAIHWNTHLNCYVMLLSHAAGEPAWAQEGIYVSYCYDISRPESWTPPQKVLDKSQFSSWYFFYPQVMGLGPGDTDRRAGQTARLYVGGVSKWEITFTAPPAAPTNVQVSLSSTSDRILAGEPATFSAVATGAAPFVYQWFKDGVALPGATSPAYQIASATLADGGSYAVVVSNALGATTSNAFLLAVSSGTTTTPILTPPPPEAFLSNLSVRALLGSAQSNLTVGFVIQSNGKKPLGLRAIGPTLALFGIPDPVADPRFEVYNAASLKVAANDDWSESASTMFAAMGAFPLPVGSADAAMIADFSSGPGTAIVNATTSGVTLVEIYDPAPSADSKIINLSARGLVGADGEVMIGGFRLAGSGTKRLLICAVGPQLEAFGVNNPLEDPVLEVYDGTTLIAANDNWEASLEPTLAGAGAHSFPRGSRDAAVAVEFTAGHNYTVVVRSGTPASGEALLEIYELR